MNLYKISVEMPAPLGTIPETFTYWVSSSNEGEAMTAVIQRKPHATQAIVKQIPYAPVFKLVILLMIENEISSVLFQAEANGAIDRGWVVTTPDISDIPVTLRAARTAGVFQFRCRLAGSVRRILVNGFLSV